MAEWLKAHAWKACIGETLSRVRIPLSPPYNLLYFSSLRAKLASVPKTCPILLDYSLLALNLIEPDMDMVH
jgi:hypothetical protein